MTFQHESLRASNDLRQVTTTRGHSYQGRSVAPHSHCSPARLPSAPDNVCLSALPKLNLQDHNYRREFIQMGVKFMQILLLSSVY
jgi:hypothetical protein